MSNHSERFVTLVDDVKSRIDEIKPEKAKKKLDSDDDFILLDVREKEEWEDSRIDGAHYLGKGVIERDIETEYPDNEQEIVLYSSGGYRSALAADSLHKMGYHNVKSLAGGFRSWVEAGLPIQKGTDSLQKGDYD